MWRRVETIDVSPIRINIHLQLVAICRYATALSSCFVVVDSCARSSRMFSISGISGLIYVYKKDIYSKNRAGLLENCLVCILDPCLPQCICPMSQLTNQPSERDRAGIHVRPHERRAVDCQGICRWLPQQNTTYPLSMWRNTCPIDMSNGMEGRPSVTVQTDSQTHCTTPRRPRKKTEGIVFAVSSRPKQSIYTHHLKVRRSMPQWLPKECT